MPMYKAAARRGQPESFQKAGRAPLAPTSRKERLAVIPENRGIYTQSDSSKKSSRNIWSLAVVSVDQRY